jgi:hypothetical protein
MTQVWPAWQVMPHLPQSASEFRRSTHTPLQSVVPAGQAQFPLVQTRFPAQTWAQNPQFVLLVCRLTHALPHRARPTPQLGEQVPALQA